jgi:chaperonin cofactor prefoldin
LLQKENEILRKKDEAWSKEFTKLQHELIKGTDDKNNGADMT